MSSAGGFEAVTHVRQRRRWRWLIVLALIAAVPLGWWIAVSPPSDYVVGEDGIWRPRIVEAEVTEPQDARSERVLPARSPRGQGEYALIGTQDDGTTPVTWDPCAPIHVEVNPRTGPDNAVALVRDALDRVEDLSGLKFEYDGETDREATFDEVAELGDPVLISWTDDNAISELEGRVAGLGGSQIAVKDDWHWYVTGTIAIDGPDLEAASDDEKRAVVMHELAHVLGLGHVEDPRELMYAESTGLTDFGRGDADGLAIVGAGRCIDW